jgi:hypothetical protein
MRLLYVLIQILVAYPFGYHSKGRLATVKVRHTPRRF